jgi:hypothetical protein
MVTRKQRTDEPKDQEIGKKATENLAGDDACRCKEAAKMSPRELLKLMMSDLAFWKKATKR